MAMRELALWLINNASFQQRLTQLTIKSVAEQFELNPTVEQAMEVTDLGYMLTCASILAHSSDGRCQDAALRIAQYCLDQPGTPVHRRDGAALVLDALENRGAIRLAEKRQLLKPDFEDRIPVVAQLEATKRRILHTITLSDDSKIVANRFQTQVWDDANKYAWLSISAPTSVGKSFILESWIQDYTYSNPTHLVIYLVPTRALISEVEADLKSRLDPQKNRPVNVASLPLLRSYLPAKSNVMVFTQERLHIFLNAFEVPPKIDVLIVDEAHKIGDRHRGVFLQQVIELTSVNNPNAKIIFASPFTSNPELLLEDAPRDQSHFIKSSDVTVNQNLIWATQKPLHPREWELSLCLSDAIVRLGDVTLTHSPTQESKRLPFVALALSRGKPGNIVYVNGAAAAEKTSLQLYDSLTEPASVDSEILALIELCEKTIHNDFMLNTTLRRGVAFHYGNMPLLVKSEIERLFSANKICYLVCTSTLVEGVNMSCKNIFVRGPRKGKSTLMGAEDFWNLAGRAGRWGKEFQGNVICVDSNRGDLWLNGEPPRTKANVKITRTTESVLGNTSTLIDYINSDNHFLLSSQHPELEHVFSYLAVSYLRYGTLNDSHFLRRQNALLIEELSHVIGAAISTLSYPSTLVARNPGISPLLMDSLYKRFSRDPDKPIERLLLADPGSADVLDSYVEAFGRITKHLSPALGFTPAQAYIRALLVVRWMRGLPLARLISDRIKYLSDKGVNASKAATIRDTMKDVEEIARYQAPRLLSCYNDLLFHFLGESGRPDLQAKIRDLGIYLELGLSQQTQISLVGMGLSRTATVFLSEFIANDNLSEEDCLRWLAENNWMNMNLPALVKIEISRGLNDYLLKQGV